MNPIKDREFFFNSQKDLSILCVHMYEITDCQGPRNRLGGISGEGPFPTNILAVQCLELGAVPIELTNYPRLILCPPNLKMGFSGPAAADPSLAAARDC